MDRYPVLIQIHRGWAIAPDQLSLVPVCEEYAFQVRTLTRREHQSWRTQYPRTHQFQDHLLRECVVSHPETFDGEPWDWDRVWAGVVDQLLTEILLLSGFGEQPHPEIMARAFDYLQSPASNYDLMILCAFDSVSLDDLFDMHPESWQKLAGQAQRKLQLLGFDPLAITDPEAYLIKLKKLGKKGNLITSGPPVEAMGLAPNARQGTMNEATMRFGELG